LFVLKWSNALGRFNPRTHTHTELAPLDRQTKKKNWRLGLSSAGLGAWHACALPFFFKRQGKGKAYSASGGGAAPAT